MALSSSRFPPDDWQDDDVVVVEIDCSNSAAYANWPKDPAERKKLEQERANLEQLAAANREQEQVNALKRRQPMKKSDDVQLIVETDDDCDRPETY